MRYIFVVIRIPPSLPLSLSLNLRKADTPAYVKVSLWLTENACPRFCLPMDWVYNGDNPTLQPPTRGHAKQRRQNLNRHFSSRRLSARIPTRNAFCNSRFRVFFLSSTPSLFLFFYSFSLVSLLRPSSHHSKSPLTLR